MQSVTAEAAYNFVNAEVCSNKVSLLATDNWRGYKYLPGCEPGGGLLAHVPGPSIVLRSMAAVANGATVRPPLLTNDELPVYTGRRGALHRETEVIENLVKAFDAFDYRTGDGSIVEFRSVVDAVNSRH